ncbi:MAG: radical SAM family heme chaperone HemW [Lachnospiraceae bacterium]|jgi:oxygen-independent coproporphyrinogen-3 oxidase|nr:radical SAM family heme chaperone HemW [Lachnospiraceae bacterium]
MKNLEIYIHIPFCIRKCNYCDFTSIVSDETIKERYVEKLIKSIENFNSDVSSYSVSTIFIGGGTPSILKPEFISKILKAIYSKFIFVEKPEITIEANPGTLNREKLKIYRRSGINRLSIGLQSADDEELSILGRIHSYEDFLQSFNLAREAGFNNINIDLMSAIPNQTIKSYRNTLRKVVELNPEHISAYSLIIEEGTPFFKNIELFEKYPLPSEEDEREMYYLTREFLSKNGYFRYEISNYAKEGYECKHNLGYWSMTPYLGFGVSASSYFEGARFKVDKNFQIIEEEKPSIKSNIEEFMFLGLRKTKGVSSKDFRNMFNQELEFYYKDNIDKLMKEGLLEKEIVSMDEYLLSLTDKGIDVSNVVLSEFLLD